jgi:hypothetical protein
MCLHEHVFFIDLMLHRDQLFNPSCPPADFEVDTSTTSSPSSPTVDLPIPVSLSRPRRPPTPVPGPPYSAGDPLDLPLYCLQPPGPRTTLHYSIVEQIDGVLHSIFGIRLERDVLAPDDTTSFCTTRGLASYECLGEAPALYFTNPADMPLAVAVAASHRACGIFIVPAELDLHTMRTIRDSKSTGRYPWLVFLKMRMMYQFNVPADAFHPPAGTPMVALLSHFGGRNARFKRKTRPERHLASLDLHTYCTPPDTGCPRIRA